MPLKVAVMQPYFFPYLGYWQLIGAVDVFVIYDDVSFIKRGWIHRNRILRDGEPAFINVPVSRASQNRLICELDVDGATPWRRKLETTLQTVYGRAPCFDEAFPLVCEIIDYPGISLADFLTHGIVTLARTLGIGTEIRESSRRYGNETLRGEARIIDICRQESADTYVNPAGGRALYEATHFHTHGLKLRFLESTPNPYPQRAGGFVPMLSIVDTLMELGIKGTASRLDDYRLVT